MQPVAPKRSTRDLQCTLSADTASVSFQLSRIFCKSLPTILFQFALGLLGPLLKSGTSQMPSLLWYSLDVHSKDVIEPSKPPFRDYVFHFCWPVPMTCSGCLKHLVVRNCYRVWSHAELCIIVMCLVVCWRLHFYVRVWQAKTQSVACRVLIVFGVSCCNCGLVCRCGLRTRCYRPI